MKKGDNSATPTPYGVTPDDQEDRMINLAVSLAEKKLKDGTASNTIIVHYLKMASTKERLEKEILAEQKKLITAKTENIQSQKSLTETYTKAIEAMKNYSPTPAQEEDYEDY